MTGAPHTSMMIRPYANTDADALVEIWRAASAVAHPFLPQAWLDQEAIAVRDVYLRHAQSWVLVETNQPAGFIAMIENEIGGLFLHPAHHGKGWGKALVDHIRPHHPSLRVDVFEKNAIGRRFYDRYGFVETDRYTHEPTGELTVTLMFRP